MRTGGSRFVLRCSRTLVPATAITRVATMVSSSFSLAAALGALLFASPLRAAKTCYLVDGTESDSSQIPCNPNAKVSACCASNKNRPDICLSSGLCYAQDAGFEGMIYSNGRTDPTGQAAECPHFCPDRTNGWKGGPTVGSYNVLQCNAGNSYCCRKAGDQNNCCGNATAVVSINVGQLQLPTKTTSVGAGATATVTASVTASAKCNTAQPDGASANNECPKDNTAIVGGAVGGVLGAALLASLGAIAVLCMRRPKPRGTHTGAQNDPLEYDNKVVFGGPPQEMPAARPIHEMPGSQLGQLASYSASNPLRVIAHIDLDAFYAQCEMVRLGVAEDRPLAVQQWQGLIAVNYPARDAGISRHCNVTEAKKLCPDLIAQHVATWREGDDKWAYRDDAAANITSDKVSLDPYRLQSRKILALVKDALPHDLQKVEKASIDEVFLDLSAHVHSVLLQRFPELANPPPYDDTAETLPLPSVAALDWQADALVDLDDGDEETQDPDWDDVAILVGSEIVRTVRARIREKLGYTCSGGIASNKLLSKLGSGFKKPNCQTVVRHRAVHAFLADFKLAKIRNLGGKLGDQVVSTFHAESVKEVLEVSLDQMKAKLGHDTGLWLYNTVRGVDTSQVNSRTQIKSMLSAKSFRPSISTPDQAAKWLRIFVADIHARLVEEGVLDNKRRPRTINLHHRTAGQTRSRQGPIPQGKTLDEEVLFQLAKELLSQIIADGNVWPCANLSLSVGGFEDGVKGNMGIGAFLVKGGADAGSPRSTSPDIKAASGDRPSKKPRTNDGGIHRFFARKPALGDAATNSQGLDATGGEKGVDSRNRTMPDAETGAEAQRPEWPAAGQAHAERQLSMTSFLCSRCKADFEDPESLQSHEDWHMAKDLQEDERVRPAFADRRPSSRGSVPKGTGASSRRGRGGKLEQGQRKLEFG
ncbi:N-acetyltransferase eso1 [Tolypocladium ophioglossoides CBS 100239]|uniref:DNA polymerase eta n=1 Tax=Tolypocladium ophioglossoides (strain CBS 100239) TaxID=1163406 RepID=A0A0L0N0P9_TOLOC|nr:N-acetyltransferase eso1 [Tolypocladium ophioglossoides CBS 100239]